MGRAALDGWERSYSFKHGRFPADPEWPRPRPPFSKWNRSAGLGLFTFALMLASMALAVLFNAGCSAAKAVKCLNCSAEH